MSELKKGNPARNITAVVLAGGRGTRLAPVLPDTPKVLAPINGRPFLSWLLDLVGSSGVDRAVLCTGYKARMVEEAMGSSHKGMELAFSREDEPLDTGGALRLAQDRVLTCTVLAMNGDSYVHANLPAYFSWFFSKGIKAGMLLVKVSDTSRYGRVEMDAKGRVERFLEKGEARGPGWINAGLYLLNKNLLSSIIRGKKYSLERDFFPGLANKGLLYGHTSPGAFLDIGTPDSYKRAEAFFNKNIGNEKNLAEDVFP